MFKRKLCSCEFGSSYYVWTSRLHLCNVQIEKKRGKIPKNRAYTENVSLELMEGVHLIILFSKRISDLAIASAEVMHNIPENS